MSDPKIATSIIDKNGKATTVHKNYGVTPASVSSRIASVGISNGVKKRSLVDDQLELISLADDIRSNFGRSTSGFTFEVNDFGKLAVVAALEKASERTNVIVWNFSHDGLPDSMGESQLNDFNSYLNSIDFERAQEAGLIAYDGDGNFSVDFDTTEKFSNY